MINQMIETLKGTFENLDEKIVKILKYGLKFCFLIAVVSVIILSTYLLFVHSDFIFEVGLIVFQLSLCFAAEFIVSAITVDTIKKQIG